MLNAASQGSVSSPPSFTAVRGNCSTLLANPTQTMSNARALLEKINHDNKVNTALLSQRTRALQ